MPKNKSINHNSPEKDKLKILLWFGSASTYLFPPHPTSAYFPLALFPFPFRVGCMRKKLLLIRHQIEPRKHKQRHNEMLRDEFNEFDCFEVEWLKLNELRLSLFTCAHCCSTNCGVVIFTRKCQLVVASHSVPSHSQSERPRRSFHFRFR